MLKLIKKKLNRLSSVASASLLTGMMLSGEADAASFTKIGQTITTQIGGLPGLITGLSYMAGSLFAVSGVLKIKDHVENPSNTPLKEGAIRLAAGGALFTLPILTDAMQNLIGEGGTAAVQKLNKVDTYNQVG